MLKVGVPIVVVEPEVVVEVVLLLPEKANAAPAPAAATAVQMSHFFKPERLEYPPGELEIETEVSADAFEPEGFQKWVGFEARKLTR